MFVWGVKYRLGLIDKRWSEQLYAVIGNLAKDLDCHPVIINGVADHIHVLLSLGNNAPSCKEIVKYLKAKSTKWINDNRLCVGRFGWQEGSGRFSYVGRNLNILIDYIRNQEIHHRKQSFRDEFEDLLKKCNIPYNQKYLPGELC